MSCRICLVSCVGQKLDRPARAADLYTSPWFIKARHYAARFDRWYILSAKYGLVDPATPIKPYEMTLNNVKKHERIQWTRGVFCSLCDVTDPSDQFVILAGAKYRETLVPLLEQRGHEIEIPMQGLGIGKQLQWLTEQAS